MIKNNGYNIIKCKCNKHYLIINPYIKNDINRWNCKEVDKMTKKEAEAWSKKLPKAMLAAEIYNSNLKYNY